MRLPVLACTLSLSLIVACSSAVVPRGTVTPQPAQCEPTDQDAYVYSPDRLEVLSPCIRVIGTIKDRIINPFDGDVAMGLELDAPYVSYLTEANYSALGGTLHVEIVCQTGTLIVGPTARAACGRNPHPMRGPLPQTGQRVWMEGRWVLDHSHGGWSELHPLYRWGPAE